MYKRKFLSAVFAASLSLAGANGQPVRNIFTIHANQVKAEVKPTMWGVFFEDINMGADGGIYAELVKNRSFEFYKPLMGWTVVPRQVPEGTVVVQNRRESNAANPRYLHISLVNAARGSVGITNEGFRGMGIKKGMKYDFSVMYRVPGTDVKLHAELVNPKGEKIGSATLNLPGNTGTWKKQRISFEATTTEQKAKLSIWFEGNGGVDLDMVSLFPQDTWKNRPGGMRADMVQLLADMKPGFIRFPGGCIVEGHDLATRYQWKKTVGPVEDRQLIVNRWNTEFAHKPAPDYFQSFGLGFFEYFQIAEDIGAEPLPILNCGMACQFNTAEVVPMDELQPYVQDALDLVEFANGDVKTKWGKIRADMGHPAPFNLKMMGIGNENWGPQYVERLKIFTKAIKDKYPFMQLVNSSGTDPNGDRFDYLNGELRKMNADIIDEHYYRRPEWFLQNASRYDNYPRTGSKIFAGEYAAQSDRTVSVNNKNNWQTALSEAAFMTGLERNADVVAMASYAPLFAHAEGWQWTPDLIWVDNLRSYGTPDYQVQKLFSLYKGTDVIAMLQNNEVVAGKDGLYGSAVIDKKTKEIIVKIVNSSDKPQEASFAFEGVSKLAPKATVTTIASRDLEQLNSFDNPLAVSPSDKQAEVKNKKIGLVISPYSFSVVRVKML
ncbi:alpha-L-arabinofuranosidase C-terminal domain-containing protein [Hufsiella ginkgonis]|uniref:non-reducing end alpha-L-arabinofuranosidase n=1 Tax=Hufsiella ginkgonis TaxID=2695274 RepID=A0A7K1Y2V9_9SPHI|nr:alpha-L-arabinofuranosidase C-terminal domain-containing protein [Hufsiella ginkgonis]MXV17016.1 alpha-L-arabinofuranosidase [Hufsiella ginkgonis]